MTKEKVDIDASWFGAIPETWSITKVKWLGRFINGYAFKPEDWGNEGLPIIRIQNLTDPEKESNHFNGDLDDKYLVTKGDYLISWSATLDVFKWEKENAYLNQHIFKVTLNRENIEYKYFYWLAKVFMEEMNSSKHGSTMQHVTKSVFDNFKVPLPPRDVQLIIANFLDEKVSEIDSIVENTKQSIKELKKYKQSLITETVTKGLDPNVEMKDSWIEWVEKIPKHWEINYLNQYFTQHKFKNEGLKENNLLSLSYGKIIRKNINTTDGLLPQSFENYNIIDNGDIVLRLTDLQNDKKSLRVGLATERGIITSAYITLRKTYKIDTNYIYYYLHSFDIYKGFYGLGSGVRQGLTYDGLKRLQILHPPLHEQEEISGYLNDKASQIDELIKKKEELLVELESYKKSLIYEYITGKKEVI
ncbi:restriction endonuclease subunit S [Gracilibacillus thailandensis]|uniref:Restriction endonuclease subunit S n=1 Tax=Gracilibacillus thailandensis TaxID=563735 RepID=A0A6N7R0P7_9BACI|nr:restriction endonuclease subunit S [Gracilibacillus thailandensis]MRI66630.1 restriction endonuclease subunit S [Gracilibacillus thailandensis]